jgi:hypothetical protein
MTIVDPYFYFAYCRYKSCVFYFSDFELINLSETIWREWISLTDIEKEVITINAKKWCRKKYDITGKIRLIPPPTKPVEIFYKNLVYHEIEN